MSREGLYKSLSADDNPSFATVLKVAKVRAYARIPRSRRSSALRGWRVNKLTI